MIAADTWRGLAAFTDREDGLPVDNVRLEPGPQTRAPEGVVGDYTSGTNIGLHLASVVAARDLGSRLCRRSARARRRTSSTRSTARELRGLLLQLLRHDVARAHEPFRVLRRRRVAVAGLITVRAAMPELAAEATRLIDAHELQSFLRRRTGLMSHGYCVQRQTPSPYHYGVFYSEARLGACSRSARATCRASHGRRCCAYLRRCCGAVRAARDRLSARQPERRHRAGRLLRMGRLRYVPSWGGSMFEALMPRSSSTSGACRRNASGPTIWRTRKFSVATLWRAGFRSGACRRASRVEPSGYREFGVPRARRPRLRRRRGYAARGRSGARRHAGRGADQPARLIAHSLRIYGDYGFYDAVDPDDAATLRAT